MALDFGLEGLSMSAIERSRASLLVVESDNNDRQNLRNAAKNLGLGGIADAPNHLAALEKLNDRKFSHIIFEAKKTNMPAKDFLHKVFEANPNVICIASSHEPNVDDVFDLLIMGARGYLCKPFTSETVDLAIVAATKGEPIADAVLQAKDRNEALVAILMASLDKAAVTLRQASQFETARREIPKVLGTLRRSAELARTFAKDGDEGLMLALEKFCIERSKGPATKLGRLRKRLQTNRAVDDPPTPSR